MEVAAPEVLRGTLAVVSEGLAVLSPHLLRPYTAQQLNLERRSQKVMVLAAIGGPDRGPSLQVHVPTLRMRVESTLARSDVVVFVDEPLPNPDTIRLVEAMLDDLGPECGLVRLIAATEAVKRLDGDVVVEGIDRSSLFSPAPPEILRRKCLEAAVDSLTDEQWVCPSALVLAAGGEVRAFDESRLARLRPLPTQ